MAKWMDAFIETYKGENEGKEPTKKEIALAMPIFLMVDTNPKGKGSMSYDRFQGYFTGPETVEEAYAAGLRRDDIRHDEAKGYIVTGDRAVELQNEKLQPSLELEGK